MESWTYDLQRVYPISGIARRLLFTNYKGQTNEPYDQVLLHDHHTLVGKTRFMHNTIPTKSTKDTKAEIRAGIMEKAHDYYLLHHRCTMPRSEYIVSVCNGITVIWVEIFQT